MDSDIVIAQKTKLQPIITIAKKIGLTITDLELYGNYKAKIKYETIEKFSKKGKQGKLILVTAINPTPAGEGKTTTTIGLGQAFNRLGHKAIICLREPSLGPVFGVKGGATGGGMSQVVPMEDINLHFTGDLHAIGCANNLVAAIIDNHLMQGNVLGIDPAKITWRRAMDMNDRSIRNIVIGLGGKANGVVREDHFDITVASEIMAVLCLSKDLQDLKKRVEHIIVAASYDKKPITIKDLGVAGSVTALLKDALKPNLVQTLEHTPAFIHGGPFANIAHGCNSIIATKLALSLADYVITEAGFGADLGAEKFFDLKCRIADLHPVAVVIVASVRALKHHGQENLEVGLENLGKHIENMKKFGLQAVVAINTFTSDTIEDHQLIINYCKKYGAAVSLAEVWKKGGKGGEDLAKKVIASIKTNTGFHQLYKPETTLEEKIETIAREIYGADGVKFSDIAKGQMKQFAEWGITNLPVCMAKTQYSLSDNPKLLNRPTGFTISINSIRLSAGAGFFVAITGDIMTMPGLPKKPAAEIIYIDESGTITGLS
ncbi:MAG: formate--tetrahydrofolate ligase [Candidatus Gottesmanbacteria bacterium]